MQPQDVDSSNNQTLKELLYRVEAERLHLQQQAAGLAENKQQLTNDVLKLQQQLAEAHAAVADSQQHVAQLSTARSRLQAQVQAATTEYRANDIIAIGLRDHITRLQHELRQCQGVCSQQASEIATFADDMAALRSCKADLSQQLTELRQQHDQLQEQHVSTAQQLAAAQQEAQDVQQHWANQHGGQTRQLQALQEAKQQAEGQIHQLTAKLEQEQRQLAQQHERCAELECELSRIRDLVVLLGTSIGRQPGGHHLPSHDDPVWVKLGPLGGVTFALDTAIKHTREQHVRVRELQAEFDKMEDRARAESAQKADLQSELYDARTLYAKAVAVREALEARTTRAEAERAAAESSLQQARAQGAEDGTRLSALQDQVMSLTQQVQQLLPLQPKLSTTEVERDTALHRLERLQEQFDQLQRQLQHATAREAGLQVEVEAYKLEHSQLLAANTQLMGQCTELNKELQALEVDVREGSLAKGQLEEAKRKLDRTKTQLQGMTARHVDTLNRLETTKELLPSAACGEGALHDGVQLTRSSRPTSAWSRSSRPGTAARLSGLPAGSTDSSPRASPRSSTIGAAQQPASTVASSDAGSTQHAGHATGVAPLTSTSQAVAINAGAVPAPVGNASSESAAANASLSVGKQNKQQGGGDGGDDGSGLQLSASAELDVLLRQKELERLTATQQQELDELQSNLHKQQEHIAELELQLLKQEAAHLQELRATEQAVSSQCLETTAEAVTALQEALQDLHVAALQGPQGQDDSSDASVASTTTTTSSSSSASCQLQGQPQGQLLRWLPRVAAQMVSSMQTVADQVQARAQLVAMRQDVGVQSDEAVQSQWLWFIRQLPDAVVSQPLHLKAASEAVIRVYVRGLSHLEAQQQTLSQQHQQHQRQHGFGLTAVDGGNMLTVFDLLMAHYIPPSQQIQQPAQHKKLAVQPYSAALWADPQGPITRLLLSCRSLAPSSVKLALFCCLVGTHAPPGVPPARPCWTVQHWQQFMLLLHAAKQLMGGLWKGVLRDWASPGGALLPLQCVMDLLGNVYNANSLAALEQQPALLGGGQQLLDAVQPVAVQEGECSRPGSAVVTAAAAAAVPLQPGSVSAALKEVLVDGPLGPASAVDFDNLLAMLMVQFDAGLLPLHPLLQPRRLTTGDLGNTTNAWGSAASEAAAAAGGGALLPARCRSNNLLSPVATAQGSLMSESSDAGRSDWSLVGSPTSGGGGGVASRPTTGASRMAAGSSTLTLPRIRTPEEAGGKQSSARSGTSSAVVTSSQAGLLSPAGGGASVSKQSPRIKKGISMSRVAFKDQSA